MDWFRTTKYMNHQHATQAHTTIPRIRISHTLCDCDEGLQQSKKCSQYATRQESFGSQWSCSGVEFSDSENKNPNFSSALRKGNTNPIGPRSSHAIFIFKRDILRKIFPQLNQHSMHFNSNQGVSSESSKKWLLSHSVTKRMPFLKSTLLLQQIPYTSGNLQKNICKCASVEKQNKMQKDKASSSNLRSAATLSHDVAPSTFSLLPETLEHIVIEALFDYCQSKDIDGVKLILNDYPHLVNCVRSCDGISLLHLATLSGNISLLKLLLDFNVDVTSHACSESDGRDFARAGFVQCNNTQTALHWAAKYNQADAIRELTHHLQERNILHLINCQDNTGATPVFLSCEYGHIEVLQELILTGASINLPRHDGATPIYIASYNGHIEAVKLLLAEHATLYKAHLSGASPLYIAAWRGHLQLVITLAKHAPRLIDLPTSSGSTPLLAACFNAHADVVEYLLCHGSNPFAATTDGVTCRAAAANAKSDEIVAMLDYVKGEVRSGNWEFFFDESVVKNESIVMKNSRYISEWIPQSEELVMPCSSANVDANSSLQPAMFGRTCNTVSHFDPAIAMDSDEDNHIISWQDCYNHPTSNPITSTKHNEKNTKLFRTAPLGKDCDTLSKSTMHSISEDPLTTETSDERDFAWWDQQQNETITVTFPTKSNAIKGVQKGGWLSSWRSLNFKCPPSTMFPDTMNPADSFQQWQLMC